MSFPRVFSASILGAAVLSGALAGQTPLYVLDGAQAGGHHGASVAMSGDLDGDGLDDVVVGQPDFDATVLFEFREDVGRVAAYSGADGSLLWSRIGFDAGEQYGFDVAIPGDFDGDGRDDVLVGRPGNRIQAGQFSFAVGGYAVVSGATGLLLFERDGTDFSAPGFGRCVTGVGDVDGDGRPEYAVGSPYSDPSGLTDAGRVYVYTGLHIPFTEIDGQQEGAVFGWALDGAWVPGLNRGALVVGEPLYGVGVIFPAIGRVSAFYVTASSTTAGPDWIGSESLAQSGWAVALVQGSDGDGILPEVAIGAPFAGAGDEGTITVEPFGIGPVLFMDTGLEPGSHYGSSVAAVGDVDGDGFTDVAAGAPDYDDPNDGGIDEGYAAVWSVATSTVIGWYGNGGSDTHFGYALAGGGDVDGDGLGDFALAMPFADLGAAAEAGRVVVYGTDCFAYWYNFGSALGGTLGVPELTIDADPVLGSTVTFTLGNSAGVDTPAALFLGVSDAALPFKGGTLWVQPLVTLPFTMPAGGLMIPSGLPADPELCGAALYWQIAVADSGAPFGVALSYGLVMFLGD